MNLPNSSWPCGRVETTNDRRTFLARAGLGFGALAAAALLADDAKSASSTAAKKKLGFVAKAKTVIFLFMHGGPSQLDTFDPKPELDRLHGQPVPESFGTADFQFTQVEKVPLMGTRRSFRRRGQSGLPISDLFEETARHADDLAVIRSCHHDGFTHVAGQNWMNTGWPRVGRPSVGSWITYGLGSENQNLPAFVVMLDGGIKAGAPSYGSGFLPAMYQGTVLRSYGPPVLNVERSQRFTANEQINVLKAIQQFNREHLRGREEDSNLWARMNAYELAFQMQSSVPDLSDLSRESQRTRNLYGLDKEVTQEFGTQCLMARRMAERGVRFIQLYSGGRKAGGAGWDGHNELDQNHRTMAAKVDQPIAALLTDLKQRGMLDSTLVIWGGDFGRTPFTDGGSSTNGRDHNPYGFTVWMAGGGIQGGKAIGATDDIGFKVADDPVHMHDLHATILSLLGIDHTALTYFFQGRDYRLTDVGGDGDLAQRLLRV